MNIFSELTESSLTALLLAAVVFFGLGAGILTFYVALPAMRLAAMVKRSYGSRLGRDISGMSSSELKFLLLSFEKMLSDLESQESRVRTLAAAVAHEVRNLAAAIRGVAEMLPLSAKRQSKEIRQESLQMERIAKSFLDFTRPVSPVLTDADLAVIVKSLVTVHSADAKKRKVQLKTGGLGTAPLKADVGLLRQMIANLLSNALRAAPKGGRVEARVEKGGDPSFWTLRVIDNGPGVPERLKDSLFEPFSGQDAGGSGLGLAIARRLAEAHGGNLVLEETGKEGAVFRVRLPREGPGPALNRKAKSAEAAGSS